MEFQIVPYLDGKKFFEIDNRSMREKIENIEKQGVANHEERVEYKVLKCFKDMNYCMKKCFEFEAKDVFARKSCKDCLDKYIQEFKIIKIYDGGKNGRKSKV